MSGLAWFDPDSLERRGPAQRAVLAGFAAWAIERAWEAADGAKVAALSAGPGGVSLQLRRDEYRRSCHVGTDRWTLEVPWDVFLSGADVAEFARADERRRREVGAARARERAAASAREAEARDRREWERLNARFGPGEASHG